MKLRFKFLAIPVLALAGAMLLANGSGYFEISKNLDIFISLYKKVDELYVDEIDQSEGMDAAINGLLQLWDPVLTSHFQHKI